MRTLKDRLKPEIKDKMFSENPERYHYSVNLLLDILDRYNYVTDLPFNVVQSLCLWSNDYDKEIGKVYVFEFFID